jgi:hypothetical protein
VKKETMDMPTGTMIGFENTLTQLLENSPVKKTLGL